MADTESSFAVTNDPIAEVIKPEHVRELMRLSRVTGLSMEEALSRSVDLFMNIEAPAYKAECRQGRRQHA